MSPCLLIGAPMDAGKARAGCLMGPDALRTAGIAETLRELGCDVRDLGNVTPVPVPEVEGPAHLHAHSETIAWTTALTRAAQGAMQDGFPIFMGGDHAMSLGTVAGVAAHAAEQGRPQFLLWLDAHADYHSCLTTQSGNLHGTPMAYVTGRDGFPGFSPPTAPIPPAQVCALGLRSVDPEERAALAEQDFALYDMRALDEGGLVEPLTRFLDQVAAANGALHVSFDVDFLDPGIAPAVGTTIPGGATFREAHLAMELLCDSGLVTSLDLAELNPFLDERGRTASLMVDLTASLLGKRIFDRPTQSFAA